MGHSVCLGGPRLEQRHTDRRTCDGCDNCPKCSAFRGSWVNCPAGYCGRSYLCPTCKPKAIRSGAHDECGPAKARMVERDRLRAEMLATGELVRCAAVGIGNGRVIVHFRNGSREAYGVTTAARYEATPLLNPAIPADYAIRIVCEGERCDPYFVPELRAACEAANVR